MNETTVTVVGTVCSDIRYGQSTDNNPIARFQIRNTPRRYDKRTGTWTDGDPNYFSAICWRNLADHVASSMGVGDPVVATGRLRISRWRRGEENVVTAELEVQAIGHDLRWGTTVYRHSTPPGGTRIPGPARRREEPAATAHATATPDREPIAAGTAASALPPAASTNPETEPSTREVMDLPAAA
ncbi:single-strand binding protein [Catenulispora acidiphila DSM 44928]|uniref:Single-strand binding protein n=1 Tax=Catenulispora acidiphila (strain DSM 44928 / JCM 14897 / NBRC 102108 / NRRL B-24433 / ID139908) TaxID=479433 RepID=C7Q9L9_CATAD|nr:single-stranded DNA-binding protein [Catenulispora acidiphila]ACU76188.1 single-strand binding protein [Catenulispora acidiphila DSM 44928]